MVYYISKIIPPLALTRCLITSDHNLSGPFLVSQQKPHPEQWPGSWIYRMLEQTEVLPNLLTTWRTPVEQHKYGGGVNDSHPVMHFVREHYFMLGESMALTLKLCQLG